MSEKQPKTVAAILQLKQDIDLLSDQQSAAQKNATFLGMTPDEVIEYNKRGEARTKLIRQLTQLQKTQ